MRSLIRGNVRLSFLVGAACLTVSSLIWLAVPWGLGTASPSALAASSSPQTVQQSLPAVSAESQLAAKHAEAIALLDQIEQAIAAGQDPGDLVSSLQSVRDQIDPLTRQILEQLDEVRRECIKAGFAKVILTRQKQVTAEFKQTRKDLLAALDQVLRAVRPVPGRPGFKAKSEGGDEPIDQEAHQSAGKSLNSAAFESERVDAGQAEAWVAARRPSDPLAVVQSAQEVVNSLAFVKEPDLHNAKPNVWEPASPVHAPVTLEDPSQPEVDVVAAAALAGPPVPEDLQPTIDVEITPEIIDKAAELGYDGTRIYEFVRNECEFQAYFGSRKGSVETLRQKAGNDYDLASLMIALLRASNISCRYAVGMVEMPVDRANSWLAVDNGRVAGSILTTRGLEGMTIYQGTPDNVVAVRCRRVWVEAFVARGRGSPTWVPLDPAFKLHEIHAGIDIPAEMGFDAQAFVDEYYAPTDPNVVLPRPETLLELFKQQISDYLATYHPGETVESVQRSQRISPENLGVLPASLPYKVRSRDTQYSEIPANRRYQIRFHLYNGGTNLIDYTANLPTIAGKRVTVSYVGATPSDQQVIDSYNGLLYTPPYLVNVIPVLKIAGQEAATGAASVGAGRTHTADVHFFSPVNDSGLPTNQTPVISNDIIAGESQAIGLAVNGALSPFLAPEDPADTEGFETQLKNGTALSYLQRCIAADDEFGALWHVKVVIDIDDAILQDQIAVALSGGGSPLSWEWRGMTVDADRKIVGLWRIDQLEGTCGTDSKAVMILGGAEGSLYENRIFEDDMSHEAVSTIKILELATAQGIPICKHHSTLPLCANSLPSYIRSALEAAILGGHEVTFPTQMVTHGNWTGIGYIDMDPCTGAAGYIIAGGQNGGSTVDSWTDWIWTNPFKEVDWVEGDVEVPAADVPDPSAIWGAEDTARMHFEYNLRVHYTDGTYGSWRPYSHNSRRPKDLSPDYYQLTVGDQGPPTAPSEYKRNLAIVGVEIDDVVRQAGLPDSVPPTKPKTVNVRITPATGVTITFSVESLGAGSGSASISANSTRTTDGPITVTGGSQNDVGKTGLLQVVAKLASGSECGKSKGFGVCAHPNGVQNGPAHTAINTSSAVGMQIAIAVKSETGNDSDLDEVLDSEQVTASVNHTGCFAGLGPITGATSGFMPATTVPPDNHTIGKSLIIGCVDSHGGGGSLGFRQLDIFKCSRCGMANPAVIPNSGYLITHTVTTRPAGGIANVTSKTPAGCTVNGYSTGAGPSPTYSENNVVRP